jgi:hypothetical protein
MNLYKLPLQSYLSLSSFQSALLDHGLKLYIYSGSQHLYGAWNLILFRMQDKSQPLADGSVASSHLGVLIWRCVDENLSRIDKGFLFHWGDFMNLVHPDLSNITSGPFRTANVFVDHMRIRFGQASYTSSFKFSEANTMNGRKIWTIEELGSSNSNGCPWAYLREMRDGWIEISHTRNWKLWLV